MLTQAVQAQGAPWAGDRYFVCRGGKVTGIHARMLGLRHKNILPELPATAPLWHQLARPYFWYPFARRTL